MGGQVNDSLESVNKTLEVIYKIISDAHDDFSSEESPSTTFLVQSWFNNFRLEINKTRDE
jgi:hypothetical protein